MSRKVISVVFFLVVTGLAGAAPVERTWTNENPVYDSWCEAGNWSPSGIPDNDDTAIIDETSPDRGPVVGVGCNVDVGGITGPDPNFGQTQVMDINTSGTFKVGEDGWEWRDGTGTAIVNINGTPAITIEGGWRGTDNGISILNIDGDPNIVVEGAIRAADESGEFYFNMSGGRLYIDDELLYGDNGGGEFNMSGGTVDVNEDLNLGGLRGSAPITFNMTGGLIQVRAKFRLPGSASRAGNVRLNLDGGVIDCNEFVHGGTDDEAPWTDDWQVDIEQGELRIWGDVKDLIDANVAAGQITAYDREGVVNVELVDGNTVVTATPPDPNRALEPRPSDLTINIDPNALLGWKPGINAATHDIYFGTDFDDVDTADTTSDVYVASQPVDQNSYDPNGTDPMKLITTYYWRIDEANGASVWKGRTWEFTTRRSIEDPNLRLWYTFDEPNGYVAIDYSGYGHDGAVDGNELLWAPDDGHPHDGGSRIFDDDGDEETVVDVPRGVLENIGGEITVSVWLKDADRDSNNYVCNAGAGGETGPHHLLVIYPTEDGDLMWRAGDDVCDVLRWDLRLTEGGTIDPGRLEDWHLWTFIKSESQDKMEVYFDGEVQTVKDDVHDTLAEVQNTAFKIGAATYSQNYDFIGAMDDFRVYDYALSAKEVAELYRGGDLGPAWGPKPPNGWTDVPRDTDLTWKAGNYATHHHVYFGTDWDDVNDADTASGEYQEEKTLGDESFDPGVMTLKQTYYWRIDEVNKVDPNFWKGRVWSFTVANFLVVDDMEDYDDDVLVPTNPINGTWIDGWWNYTGSTVYLEYGGGAILHGGAKSMWLEYDNNYGPPVENYSEIHANTTIGDKNLGFGRDWTADGMKTLTLYFYGDPNNAVEPLYVALEDTGTPGNMYVSNYGDDACEDINDVNEAEWHVWDVALSDFWDGNNVDINDVNKIYIGLGDRYNPVAGGTGNLYIDNIRLYLPRCVPCRAKPALDFSDNCIVDFADIRLMAGDWLESDIALGTTTAPNSPVLHYAFDVDESGSTITDSSGNDYHGMFFVDANQLAGDIRGRVDPNGKSGNSFHFQANDAGDLDYAGIKIPSAVFSTISQDVTVSLWVKNVHSDERPDSGASLFDFRPWDGVSTDANDTVLGVDVDGRGDDYTFVDESDDVGYDHDWDAHLGWEHYAFVRNDSNLAIYVNGVLKKIDDSNGSPIPKPDLLYLGIASDRAPDHPDGFHDGFTGNVDEFKIFDYALSAAEIAYIADHDDNGIYEMESPYNIWSQELIGSRAVNFKDYAVLIDDWLEEILWP